MKSFQNVTTICLLKRDSKDFYINSTNHFFFCCIKLKKWLNWPSLNHLIIRIIIKKIMMLVTFKPFLSRCTSDMTYSSQKEIRPVGLSVSNLVTLKHCLKTMVWQPSCFVSMETIWTWKFFCPFYSRFHIKQIEYQK